MELGDATWQILMSTKLRTLMKPRLFCMLPKKLVGWCCNAVVWPGHPRALFILGLDFTWSIRELEGSYDDYEVSGKWPFNHLLGDEVILDCQSDRLAKPEPYLTLLAVDENGDKTLLMDSSMYKYKPLPVSSLLTFTTFSSIGQMNLTSGTAMNSPEQMMELISYALWVKM